MTVRENVLAMVQQYPGVHPREVERRLGLASRLATYHLEDLERSGAVQCVHETGFSRYFPAVGRPRWSRRDMEFLGLMRRAVSLRITILLLTRGPLVHGEIAQELGLAKPSISYHLRIMTEPGLVVVTQKGRHRSYRIKDAAYVRGMLANFTPIPEDLDAFAGMWNDLFSKGMRAPA